MKSLRRFGVTPYRMMFNLARHIAQRWEGPLHALRAELGRPFALPNVTAELTPYLFAATGEAVLEQPSILELEKQRASNWGAGVRFAVPQTAAMPVEMSGFFEGARKVTDDPFQQPGWRVFTGMSLRY